VLAHDLGKMLAQDEIVPAKAGVYTSHQALEPKLVAPVRLPRMWVALPAAIVGLDRAAHQHQGRRSRQTTDGVRGQGSQAVSLDEDPIQPPPFLPKELAHPPGEGSTGGGTDENRRRLRRRVADLDPSCNPPRQDRESEPLCQPVHEPDV